MIIVIAVCHQYSVVRLVRGVIRTDTSCMRLIVRLSVLYLLISNKLLYYCGDTNAFKCTTVIIYHTR